MKERMSGGKKTERTQLEFGCSLHCPRRKTKRETREASHTHKNSSNLAACLHPRPHIAIAYSCSSPILVGQKPQRRERPTSLLLPL